MPAPVEHLREIVAKFKQDPESVYNTWFRESPERLKAFRSIRRGIFCFPNSASIAPACASSAATTGPC